MTIFDLYSNAIKSEHIALPCEPVKAICAFTGIESDCVPKKLTVSTGFTNVDLLKNPDSKMASVQVFQTLKHRWERSSSWIVTDTEFIRLKGKQDIRGYVLNGISANQWAGYITTSYKKHGAFKVVVNSGDWRIWGFENIRVDCSDAIRVNEWYSIMLAALKSGIWRSIIESCDCPAGLIIKIGHERWLEYYEWAKTKYKNPLYQFLCYLLPGQEELKNEISES